MLVRWTAFLAACAALVLSTARCGGPSNGGGTCSPGDQNGISGGSFTYDVTVDDTGFRPVVLSPENDATVTLTVTNMGTRPHDFVVECMPTPNGYGCPAQSCFPAAANIPSLAPGASMTTTFVTPSTEGLYAFVSDLPADAAPDGGTALMGQFNVQ